MASPSKAGKRSVTLDRDYASQEYWEERYAKKARGEEDTDDKKETPEEEELTNEWLYDFEQLQELLPEDTLTDPSSVIVDVGCGLSSLLADARAAGAKGRLVGIDYAPTAIEEAKKAFPDSKIDFCMCDAAEKLCEAVGGEGKLTCAIDKATIDGLLCTEDNQGADVVKKIAMQVGKALKVGGSLVWCTMFGPDGDGGLHVVDTLILPGLIEGSNDGKWEVDCHCFEDADEDLRGIATYAGAEGAGDEEDSDHSSHSDESEVSEESADDDDENIEVFNQKTRNEEADMVLPPRPSVFVFTRLQGKIRKCEGLPMEEKVLKIKKRVQEHELA